MVRPCMENGTIITFVDSLYVNGRSQHINVRFMCCSCVCAGDVHVEMLQHEGVQEGPHATPCRPGAHHGLVFLPHLYHSYYICTEVQNARR